MDILPNPLADAVAVSDPAQPSFATLPDLPPASPPGFAGIPVPADPPAVMVSQFGQSPWDAQEQAHAEQMAKWRDDMTGKIDKALTNPDAFFKDQQLPFATDRQAAMRTATNDLFLATQAGTADIPTGGLERHLHRMRVADELFDGKGADSEDAFHSELIAWNTRRKEQNTLVTKLAEDATNSAILHATDPGHDGGWAAAREKLSTDPAWKSLPDADAMDIWHQQRTAAREAMLPYAPQLAEVWDKMKQGGQGTASEVINQFLMAPSPVAALPYAVNEATKLDAAATAFHLYSGMGEKDRAGFMEALGFLARSLPKEEQPAFWSNMAKEGGRAVDALGRDSAQSFLANSISSLGAMPTTVAGPAGNGQFMTQHQADSARAEFMARRNFASDVRDLQQGVYDPTKSAFSGPKMGMWEKGAYMVPGMLAFTAEAAIPGVGLPMAYLSMQGQAYDSLRNNLRQQTDDATASRIADTWAPIVAAPQAAMLKLQAGMWLGKVPGLSKAMDALGDTIENRLLRGTVKTVAGAAAGNVLMEAQNLMPVIAQDVAHKLDAAVPGANFSGPGGYLDGFWVWQGETFVSMLPLAMIGAVGGVSAEARARAFKEATPTERLAMGIRPEHSVAIDAAGGQSSLNRAVEEALANRDPNTPEARAAVDLRVEEVRQQMQAAARLRDSGMVPVVTATKDGFAVTDSETGATIGTAATREEAMRIVTTHTESGRAMDEDRVAYMGSMLDAAAETVKRDPNSAAKVETGNEMTPIKAEAEGIGTAERYAAQVALEQHASGDGEISDIINGTSQTAFNQGVRATLNRMFAGSSVLTAVHEFGHGKRAEARSKGIITREEEISFLRSLDEVLGGKVTKDGEPLRFIPDGMADADVSEVHLDEAFSKVLEMEVLRSRDGGTKRKAPGGRDSLMPSGIVTTNLKAIGRMIGAKAAGKFADFFNAIRAHFGVVFARALALKKAERAGTFDAASYDAHISKVLGLSEVDEHAGMVRDEHAAIMGREGMADAAGDNPFSLGRAWGNERNPDGSRKDGVPTNEPGGADNGDGSSSGNEVVTPEMDRLYLAAVASGDMATAQRMVDEAAKKLRNAIPKPEIPKLTSQSQFESFLQELGSDLIERRINKLKSAGIQFVDGYHVTDAKASDFSKKGIKSSSVDYIGKTEGNVRDSSVYFFLDPDDIENGFEGVLGSKSKVPNVVHLKIPVERLEDIRWDNNYNVTFGTYSGVSIKGNIPEEYIKKVYPFPVAETAPVIRDSSGNVMPLSSRFEKSTPAVSGDAFSLAPRAMADALKFDAISRIRNPVVIANIHMRTADKLAQMHRTVDEWEVRGSSAILRRAIVDPQDVAVLKKQAAWKEAFRRAELEDAINAKYQGLTENHDLVLLKQQPVHEALADPSSNLRGRLMSPSAATARGVDFFDPAKHGDYDGADGVSRSVFGGRLMPDQAAQELYDHHLIKSPTPDAMWDALRKEQASVGKMREQLAKARTEIAQARIQARQEAQAWLTPKLAEQARDYSPKARLLRAMAMADAIMSTVPPDVRGRLGGYTALARLGSDEARLQYLHQWMARADVQLETYFKRSYGDLFKGLLEKERVKTNEPGEKPTGKAGPEVHALFATVRKAMSWTPEEADAHIAALESELNDTNREPTPEREAALMQEIALIPQVADWDHADSARRASAFRNAQDIYDGGFQSWKTRKLAEREQLAAGRRALKKDTGKAGTETGRKQLEEQGKSLVGKSRNAFLSLLGFEQAMGWSFGDNSPHVRRLVDMERWAANDKADGIHRVNEGLRELFAELAGKAGGFDRITALQDLAGVRLKERLAEARQDAPDKPGLGIKASNGTRYSELEAIQATMMWRQPDGRRHMEGPMDDNGNFIGEAGGKWTYDQAFVDSLEAGLSPEAKAVRQYLSDQYAAEWARLNPIYRKLNGIDLPRNELYSPLTVEPARGVDPQMVDPVTGSSIMGNGFTPGSLKTRGTSITRPRFRDALQVFEGHSIQMEHWMAYAAFTKEIAGLLKHEDVRLSVIEKAGPEASNVLSKWADLFARGGNIDAAAHLALTTEFSRALNGVASAALVGRMTVLGIQSLNLGGAMLEMPVASYAKRLAMLHSGQLGWGEAMKSPYIQRRLQEKPPLLRHAMQGLASGLLGDGHMGRASDAGAVMGAVKDASGLLKYEVSRIGNLIGGADALFTAGTYAIVYDYQLHVVAKELGLKGEDAVKYAREEAERKCERVSQPVRMGTRSLTENLSNNPAMRLAWAFSSEARQKTALLIYDMIKAPPAQKARTALLVLGVQGIMQAALRAVMRDARDDKHEWFDERNWSPKMLLLNTLSAPLQGIPFAGDALTAALYQMAGQYAPEGTLFSAPQHAGQAAKRIYDQWGNDRDNAAALKDVEAILTATALLSGTGSSLTSVMHIVRDMYGIVTKELPKD